MSRGGADHVSPVHSGSDHSGMYTCIHVHMYTCTYGHMYIFTCVHNVSQMRQHLKLKVQFLSATFRSNQQ